MQHSSVTIREAIRQGQRQITFPSKMILIGTPVLGVLLSLCMENAWYLLFVPAGVLFSILYTARVAAKWRLWAYGSVDDIHQFQRSAELAGLLMRQSYDRISGFLNASEKAELVSLQKRFLTDAVFFDDVSVPPATNIISGIPFGPANALEIVLTASGIHITGEGFSYWHQVSDDHIALVSFKRTDFGTGMDRPAGSKEYFRFSSPLGRYEIPISSLDITGWELDFLLYIYRGRFESQLKTGSFAGHDTMH